MQKSIITLFGAALVLSTAGCSKPLPPVPALNVDACELITGAEIESVVSSPLKETKSNVSGGDSFHISQCFFATAEFNRSVSLAVTQLNLDSAAKRSPTAYWEEMFGKYENGKESEEDKEREGKKEPAERRGEEEEEGKPPQKIAGVGDEAFWSSGRMGGALYALKRSRDAFIRVSIGGPDKEQDKIEKTKKLALKALERL